MRPSSVTSRNYKHIWSCFLRAWHTHPMYILWLLIVSSVTDFWYEVRISHCMFKMELTTILTIFVLNIFLPTFDTITDIILVTKLYKGQYNQNRYWFFGWFGGDHTKFYPIDASVLLVPFLLNYVVCWYTFYREARYKKYTFIFPLLNLYPQFGKTNISYGK